MSLVDRNPLRFGILCQGTTFPAWQAQCIRHLLELDGTEPALLVIDATPRRFEASLARSRLRRLLSGDFSLWEGYHRIFADRHSDAQWPVDLSRQLAGVPTLAPNGRQRSLPVRAGARYTPATLAMRRLG